MDTPIQSSSVLRLKLGAVAPATAPTVTVTGYFYAVDLGPEINPQQHRVGKNAVCSCYLAENCPAVDVVRSYLANGGERVADPPPGFYPVIPHRCPICHAKVSFDQSLSSKHRGAGWRCTAGGSAHYWQRRSQILKENLAANPWLFPPVVVREGEQVNAYDGIQPGDQVLYAGVLRADVSS